MRKTVKSLLSLAVILSPVVSAPCAQNEESGTPLTAVALETYGSVYLVDVGINDRGPYKFIVDTGTSSTILHTATARELGLSSEDERGDPRPRVGIDVLTLGSMRFTGVEAEVRDLEEVWGDGAPSGVFGFDLFGDRLVTLDLPLQRLEVFDGGLPSPDGREILSYSLETRTGELGERRVPVIEILVADRKLKVELSPLGFGTLALPKNEMEQLPLASEVGVIGHSKSADGVFPILGTSLEGTLTLGRHRFDNPSVFFSEAFDHASLGSGTLEPFVLTLDPGNRRVRIHHPSGRTDPLVTQAAALMPQSGAGRDIRTVFNENADRVRLMVLLSPT